MPNAPKRTGQRTKRQPWQRSGHDLRKGFRGRKRQEAKQRVLIRDACECQQCGQLVDTGDSHLDHIIPLSQGGTHDDENLQTLCKRCSKAKTQRESRESRP